MNRGVRIGTRGSELALWQARLVAAELRSRFGATSEIVVIRTAGDRDARRALHEMPGTGFFTKELQRALADGEVDLVVHSLKDLPTEEPDGLLVAAVLAREDPRELLLARQEALGSGALGLAPGVRLATSSLRRAAQALALQPDLSVVPLRGNVPTRVRRVRDGECDATLLAWAGVKRLALDLSGLAARQLETRVFLPAPGQGALAIETRAADDALRDTVGRLGDSATAAATTCERLLLKGLGGGCHLPLGALARAVDGGFELDAALGQLDQSVSRARLRRVTVVGSDPHAAARAALAALQGERIPA
jgi:hydroxymethylbilane synthase